MMAGSVRGTCVCADGKFRVADPGDRPRDPYRPRPGALLRFAAPVSSRGGVNSQGYGERVRVPCGAAVFFAG